MSASEARADVSLANRRSRFQIKTAAAQIPVEVWVLVGLTVLAAAIRVIWIGSQSYWTDEALTAYEAQLPFGAMLNTVAHVETTPPLYFILVWCTAKLFGTGEVALRSVSALAGIAVIPLAYFTARELVSRRAGVLAAALATVSPCLVWYSQEARSYMLLAALGAASFLWFVRALSDPAPRNLRWWAIFSALAIATHYFAGYLVAPEAIWLLWRYRRRTVAVAVGVVGIAQAAMVPLAFVDSSHGINWIHVVSLKIRVASVPLLFGLGTNYRAATTDQGLLGGAIFAVIIVLLVAIGGDARTRRGARVAAVIVGVTLLAPILVGFVGPDVFLSRNVIAAWVPLVCIVAAACVAPRTRAFGIGLAVTMLAVFSYATVRVQANPALQKTPWRSVAQALGHSHGPRAILAAGGERANPLKIYLPGVPWVQPHQRLVLVSEIDVVGSVVPTTLDASRSGSATDSLAAPVYIHAAARPAAHVAGTIVIERLRLGSFLIARFALKRARLVNVDQLEHSIAARFFRHAPLDVNGFVAPA